MKRATSVRLVLLGSALGLHACDSAPQTIQQQRYASQEDCKKDWGDSGDCRSAPPLGSGGHAYYYGPRYYWDGDAGKPRVVNDDGTTRLASSRVGASGSSAGETRAVGHISRGGFGGSAHGSGGE